MVELDVLNNKYKDCMQQVEKLKMDLRYDSINGFNVNEHPSDS